jgi:hypothetical protein
MSTIKTENQAGKPESEAVLTKAKRKAAKRAKAEKKGGPGKKPASKAKADRFSQKPVLAWPLQFRSI